MSLCCIAVRGGGQGWGGTLARRISPLLLHHARSCSSWCRPPQKQKVNYCSGSFSPPSCSYRQASSTTSSIGSALNNSPITTEEPSRRLSVAIVGAGPSGFYAAKYLSSALLKKIHSAAPIDSILPSTRAVAADNVDDDGGVTGILHTLKKTIPTLPSSTTNSDNRINNNSDNNNYTSNFCYSGIDIDILERLPTPYGLVRYGVAPDHPEVKNVENEFASLFSEQESRSSESSSTKKKLMAHHDSPHPRHTTSPAFSLSYFGNVDVGHDISLPQLQNIYDIVVLAYGCQSSDKRLGIPGEAELDGVLSARELVAWYNGHPEFGHIGRIVHRCLWPSALTEEKDEGATDGNSSSDTSSSDSNSSTTSSSTTSSTFSNDDAISKARVVVIGQGNVALDVARILSKGKKSLMDTDTPSSVLDVLKGGVSHVSIVGRRGHVQGAFTIKEIRELTKLRDEGHDVAFQVRKDELELGMTESSLLELKGSAGRPKTRLVKLLQEVAESTRHLSAAKQVELRFLMNPIRFESDDSIKDRVGRVMCERTKLVGDPFHQQPVGTDETEEIRANLVLVSIGYRGMPLEGMKELQIFDDKRGVVKNVQGKVEGENNLFVTGWIKRGPLGIIGTNIMDAKETVASIMEFIETRDLDAQQADGPKVSKGRVGLTEFLGREGVESINWSQFLKIDAAESDRARLRCDGQPREKIISTDEMLKVAFQQ